jgi:hypothetical protein
MFFQNERGIRKTSCALCGQTTLSMFNDKVPHVAYCHSCWWGDKWDALNFGRDYDDKVSFWNQFFELFRTTPTPAVSNENPINSDYVNHTSNAKNCYLIFFSGTPLPNEDCYYSYRIDGCRGCIDTAYTTQSEDCYELMDGTKCNKVQFGRYVEETFDSMFLDDCKNCSDCFGCSKLRNRNHCIYNEQYSKADYERERSKIDLGSYANLENFKMAFAEFNAKTPKRFANIIKSENCTGDNITGCKNCRDCYVIKNSEDSRFAEMCPGGVRDCYDLRIARGEQLYEDFAVLRSSNVYFSVICLDSKNVQYSYFMINCSDCFGCVGLKNKQFCILNKQYAEEEYRSLLPRIIANMNGLPYTGKNGAVYKYGEFFPLDESPYLYYDTPANEVLPLSKEEVILRGLNLDDELSRNYKVTVAKGNIPDHIRDVPDSITNEILECAHKGQCLHRCATAFRITPFELAYYKKFNLALPTICSNCRHYERIKSRNPLKLWHRKCMNVGCQNEFETSYSPDRPEIIYCESCYQQEVV